MINELILHPFRIPVNILTINYISSVNDNTLSYQKLHKFDNILIINILKIS